MGGSLADAWHPPMLIEAIKGDTRRQDAIVENIQGVDISRFLANSYIFTISVLFLFRVVDKCVSMGGPSGPLGGSRMPPSGKVAVNLKGLRTAHRFILSG